MWRLTALAAYWSKMTRQSLQDESRISPSSCALHKYDSLVNRVERVPYVANVQKQQAQQAGEEAGRWRRDDATGSPAFSLSSEALFRTPSVDLDGLSNAQF